MKYYLSYLSPDVESFSSIFYQYMKGVLTYLRAESKDRMKLYKKKKKKKRVSHHPDFVTPKNF